MSILWITLAVLAGAFIVGGTAAYFFRARYMETVEATASNLQSVAAPVPIAEEVRAIGTQIERAMTESRLQGETQRQLLAQKLDSVRQSVETQRNHVDGIRNELRHEIRRRDVEMSEIKTQISTISTTIGLPASPRDQPALPPAAPAPTEEAEIPALANPTLAPPPFDPALDYDAPVVVDAAPAEPTFAEPQPEALAAEDADAFGGSSFEPSPYEASSCEPVSFASVQPGAVDAPPAEPAPAGESSEADLPVAMPVEDFDVLPPFVIDPVGDAERDAAEAVAPHPPAPEATLPPRASDATPEAFDADAFSFVDVPLAAGPADPRPEPSDAPAAPAAPAAPFGADELSGDSFAEVSFQDLSFAAPPPATAAPSPQARHEPETTDVRFTDEDSASEDSAFEGWAPAPPPPALADLPSLETLPTAAPTDTEDDLGPWVARPARDEADASPFSFGEPILASASDFLPSTIPPSAPEPAAPAEPEAVAPVAPTDSVADAAPEPAPTPDHADNLTVISSIDEDVQRLLYAEGVYTLDQIAQMTRTTARAVSHAVQVSEETIMTQWVFEAQSALFTPFSTGSAR